MDATRQLAAIMFTDMEGYTALMQKNEQAAIERRTRHREVFEKTMADHGGKIIQYYGDGTLSIFSSAIHAVNAGLGNAVVVSQRTAGAIANRYSYR